MNKNKFYILAYQILRVGLGVSMFTHGASRLGPNFQSFVLSLDKMFSVSILPDFLVTLTAYMIVPTEIVVGVLLLLGIAIVPTLLTGSGLMFILLFGMGLLQKWDIVAVQLFYVLLYSVLLAFAEQNQPIWKLKNIK